MSARLGLALVALTAAAASACSSEATGIDFSPPPPPRVNEAPHVASIEIPTWPPLGPTGAVDVKLTDDESLATVRASFRDVRTRSVSGREGSVRFFGPELGEGQGRLRILACDTASACRERAVENLLVDLTPPEIFLEKAVVSSLADGVDGQVAVWVSDGWVLGSVELAFRGKVFRHEMPHAYPSTLGTERDTSRVAFPGKDFPEGAGTAVIIARDAAGNARKEELALRIDGKPPSVAIAEPAAGAPIAGTMTLRLVASDDSGVAPTVDVWVGGARVLAGVTAGAPLLVDTSTFAAGPTEIRAVARDEAGNESAVARTTVQLVP